MVHSIVRQQKKRSTSRYQIDVKKWDRRFFNNRPCPEFSYMQTWRKHDTSGDTLDIFLHDFECPIPSYLTEVVYRFCQNTKSGSKPDEDTRARSWVHDREWKRNGRVRDHPLWLTAADLRKILEEQRFGLKDTPDADRRLIYIARLDREFLLSLAETVSQTQVAALRDAVWKHIAFESSIRVHIPLFGFASFRLELHLPYLMLRASSAQQANNTWVNLSFLNMEPNEKGQGRYTVQRAHISFAVCGSDHFRWIAYAFANPRISDLDGDDREDDDSSVNGVVDNNFNDDTDDESLESEEDESGDPKLDYMGSDGQGRVVPVDHQRIHDPRRYFLCVVEQRVAIVAKEWDYLVAKIERSVRVRDDRSRAVLSVSPTDIDQQHVKQLLDWNVSTQRLLNQLSADLSRSLRVWEDFAAPGGDICYFSDISHAKTRLRMNAIRESFDRMAVLERKVATLDSLCDGSINILARCMEAESNRLSFASHQLNHETSILSHDMHRLNRQNTELAKETSVISRDMHRLNLQNTEFAKENSLLSRKMHRLNLESTNFAKDTSRITRVNVQLIWVTTPFVLVLQYFGSEKAIFSFERNTKSFGISVCVLLLALPLLTWVLNILNNMGKMAVGLLCVRMGRNSPSKKAVSKTQASVETIVELEPLDTVPFDLQPLPA